MNEKKTRRAPRFNRTQVDEMITNALEDERGKMRQELSREIMTSEAFTANSGIDPTMRQRMAAAISGGYDYADTLHNVYLDFGYPATLSFDNFWNMYRRFGIATRVVEFFPDAGWSETPTFEDADPQFQRDFEKLDDRLNFWVLMRGLDVRQRVGRYAGMFMRVRDNKTPDQPLEGKLVSADALVQMVPLYEGELKVLTTQDDITKDDYSLPTMYQLNTGGSGNRNEKNAAAVNIHPSRIVIAAEGADNGNIYGIPALENIYNSLLDLRKIAGAGGEGFYRNAAQSVMFKLDDPKVSKGSEALLDDFNENFDNFTRNRMRRGMWTPGMTAQALESHLINPKEFFTNSLNDVAAGSGISASLLIGNQTGVLAGDQDSRSTMMAVQSRRENFQTRMTRDVIDWCVEWGALPASEYTLKWPDALALSDEERLANSFKMADTNVKQFNTGQGNVFTTEEIREAGGYSEVTGESTELEGDELEEQEPDSEQELEN